MTRCLFRSRARWIGGALGALAVVSGLALAANTFVATVRQATNTTGNKNQNPTVDKGGKFVVFTSDANHVAGVTNSPTGTFDYNGTGNGFPESGAPTCPNCAAVDDPTGQIFLWSRKTNVFTQLTFVLGDGFSANQLPDINQKGKVVAWDSSRDHVGTNADGNREIFIIDLATLAITQLTNTTGGGDTANRSANWRDDGNALVFDSTRDFAGVLGCTLPDGTTACDNSDGNSEIMLYDRTLNKLTQITSTTGSGGNANLRARISSEGKAIAFQSTSDFSGVLPGGTTCAQRDGSACGNDGNGEIMLFKVDTNALTQITNTTNAGDCSGNNPNERVEISKGGNFVTWQSTCEAQLNPSPGCGSCDGHDEAFLYDGKKTKNILQVTISSGGFNRVPRVSGKGGYIIFESNRNYAGLNPTEKRTLYVIKRSTKAGSGGQTGIGQVVADPGSTLAQAAKTQLVGINFAGGFNTTVEGFGASNNGRFFVFDNKTGVGNQEIWWFDRKK